jgi:uncharacterized protein involved in exopolysaccharide biosynthesis
MTRMTPDQEFPAATRQTYMIVDDVDPTTGALIGAVNSLLRYRRVITVFVAICVAATIVYGLTSKRTFTSSGSFILQSRSSAASGLTGLAVQFGVAVPGNEANQSPQFFADLIGSREILVGILDSLVESTAGSGGRRLIDVLDVVGASEAARRDEAVRTLSNIVTPSVNQRTGLVRVAAQTESSTLSRDIVGLLLRAISRFNVQRRQSQAAAEEQFNEKRLADAQAELRSAEEDLRYFMERNRDYRNSPALQFQQERLSRRVSQKEELYLSLARAYDQARVESVRDTPALMIVESPAVPTRPDSRGILKNATLALFVGATIGIFVALTLGLITRTTRSNTDVSREFESLGRDTLADLRRPWRFLMPARTRAIRHTHDRDSLT